LSTKTLNKVILREPRVEDGGPIWSLVKDTGVLDLNSAYSYLMLCQFFKETCVVAEQDGEVVGFISAYRLPTNQDTIFVWQVGVAASQRRKGLAGQMLEELLQRETCKKIRYLETTISPSNRPSQSLFQALARNMNTHCEVVEGFPKELFPGGGHESEMMYRIGPFKRKQI